jgi:hypothetical protein
MFEPSATQCFEPLDDITGWLPEGTTATSVSPRLNPKICPHTSGGADKSVPETVPLSRNAPVVDRGDDSVREAGYQEPCEP